MNEALELEEIEKSKGKIAYAIAMSIANGNRETTELLFPRFFHDLSNTNVFFLNAHSYSSKYELERNEIIQELIKFTRYDPSAYLDGRATVKIRDFFDGEPKAFVEFYKKNANKYAEYGIEYDGLKEVYQAKKIKELDGILKKLKKYKIAKNIFDYYIRENEFKALDRIDKKFIELKNKFKVSTLDDLFALGTEVDSFLVSPFKMNAEQRKILEANRDSFRKRIGAKKSYMLNVSTAKKLKEKINEVYNFHIYTQVFNHSNIKDFFNQHQYQYTVENLKSTIGAYLTVLPSAAICFQHDYGDGRNKHCFFGSFLQNKPSYFQNRVILHEFVHALESYPDWYKGFGYNYNAINEAMTEYLAARAQEYLNKPIITPKENESGLNDYACKYESMLGLVRVLEDSPYWGHFLRAKFDNQIDELEQTLGKNNFKEIDNIFRYCSTVETFDGYTQQNLENKLSNLLLNIEKEKNVSK